MKRNLKSVLSALLVVAMLAGCTTKPATPAASTPADGATPASEVAAVPASDLKRIIYAISEDPREFDPTLNNYTDSSTILQNLHRGLFRIGRDNKPQNALCESYTVNEDFTKWEFKIIKDAKFSDGTPITAKDFEYSIKRLADPAVASKAAGQSYFIKGGEAFNDGTGTKDGVAVKAIDDYTLDIETAGPTPFLIDLLATVSFAPVKEAAVNSAVGKEGWTTSPETYVTSGPFKLKEAKPGERYIIEKNPNYFDAANVKIDEVEFLLVESKEAAVVAYENNEIDAIGAPPAVSLADYKDKPDFNDTQRITIRYYDFNTSHEVVNNPLVRKALSYSINREEIVDISMDPNTPAYGFIPPVIPNVADKTKEYRATVGDLFKMDVEKAKALLAEAGYPDGKDFPKLTFIISVTAPNPDIAQAMQAMWKENLNIDVEIKQFESKLYWDEIYNGNYDIAYDGWTGDYPDPGTMFYTMDWPKQETETRWKNDEFVALLKENREIGDQVKRQENFVKAEKLLMEEMPIIPVWFNRDYFYAKPNIKGIYRNYIAHTFFEEAIIE